MTPQHYFLALQSEIALHHQSNKDLSPCFEVKKLLTVANKIGNNFAIVVITIFENLSLICLGWVQKVGRKTILRDLRE
jgi:hypothetical protein